MFIEALVTVAKKQPKCTSVDECIKRICDWAGGEGNRERWVKGY